MKLTIATKAGDFVQARRIGHQLRGNGGSYGYDEVSELGAAIEAAAERGNADEVERNTEALKVYIDLIAPLPE